MRIVTGAGSATVDSSIRLVLEHRVGAERADQLLQDVVDDVAWAGDRLGISIGSWNGFRPGAHGYYWTAPLEGGMEWDGRDLTFAHKLPEVVMTALTGHPLSDLVEHPALPADRIIEMAYHTGDGMRVTCAKDHVPIATLIRGRQDERATSRRRKDELKDMLTRSRGGTVTAQGKAAVVQWIETQKAQAHQRLTHMCLPMAA